MAPPELRWGVVGTGWIPFRFVADLAKPRENGSAKHKVTAIGTSSNIESVHELIEPLWQDPEAPRPQAYASYQEVYDSPDVDIVYVATPRPLCMQNCLDAIKAGKHVLCEMPFTINSKEAQAVVDAAKARGVFLMEGVWTRFLPWVIELQNKIQSGAVGRVRRSIVEIGLALDWDTLPETHRIRDPAFGAGALLDIGVDALTYASLVMDDGKLGTEHPLPAVTSSLTINKGIDESDVIVLQYNKGTSTEATSVILTTLHHENPQDFGRIEGTKGSITLYNELAPSRTNGFRVKDLEGHVEDFRFEHPPGFAGFIHEADAVAQDIAAGRTENATMPLDETVRMMRLMDEIRKQNGLVYDADKA